MSGIKLIRQHKTMKSHLTRKELFDVRNVTEVSQKKFWQMDAYMHKQNRKERIFMWTMLILVLVESAFLFLQAGKGFSTKSAKDVDLSAFILLLVTNVAWFLYGIFILKDLPVIISGFLYIIGSILIIVTIALYGDK